MPGDEGKASELRLHAAEEAGLSLWERPEQTVWEGRDSREGDDGPVGGENEGVEEVGKPGFPGRRGRTSRGQSQPSRAPWRA